jgi:hypothetical protein
MLMLNSLYSICDFELVTSGDGVKLQGKCNLAWEDRI